MPDDATRSHVPHPFVGENTETPISGKVARNTYAIDPDAHATPDRVAFDQAIIRAHSALLDLYAAWEGTEPFDTAWPDIAPAMNTLWKMVTPDV